jgi:aminoglycoside/choline kinase family phosphotransferase
MMTDLEHWLNRKLSPAAFSLTPLAGDASFRQYYRLHTNEAAYIAAYSPPATEDNAGFIKMSEAFLGLGLDVPQVLDHHPEEGFFLLTDLGDNTLLHHLTLQNADHYYQQALEKLGKIQQCEVNLPTFDRAFMAKELDHFKYWFLEKHLGLTLSAHEETLLASAFSLLLDSATNQPQCCIHRDYHSRNLMILADDRLGILDFQDAMIGPITYDLASLIRDCYIAWPPEKVHQWALGFYHIFLKEKISSSALFLRYFDLMGMQRHLKAIFIFARKYHRDGVNTYLADIPRTLNYVLEASKHYPEFREFRTFMIEKVVK